MEGHLCRAKIIGGNKGWEKGYYAKMGEGHHYLFPGTADFCKYEIDPDTLCRQIGKRDRCGREIFEGDIIKHYNDLEHPEYYELGIIEWYGNQHRWANRDADGKRWFIWESNVYEVAGNVFDNPELTIGFAA